MGASWLATLGAHIMDYRKLSRKCYCDDKFVTLLGEKEHGPQPAYIHKFYKISSVKSIAKCYKVSVELVKIINNNSSD